MIDLKYGDAYKLIKEIPDKSIDLIYTDIPYLIKTGGHSEVSELSKSISNLDSQLKDIKNGINYTIFDEFKRVLKYIYIYIYMV